MSSLNKAQKNGKLAQEKRLCGKMVGKLLVIGVGGNFGRGDDWGGNFLVLVLELIELVVNAVLCQQLLMVSDLAYLTFVHDNDLVRTLNGGKAMRDDDGSPPFDHTAERLPYTELRFRIDAGCGFVEDQDFGVVCKSPRK